MEKTFKIIIIESSHQPETPSPTTKPRLLWHVVQQAGVEEEKFCLFEGFKWDSVELKIFFFSRLTCLGGISWSHEGLEGLAREGALPAVSHSSRNASSPLLWANRPPKSVGGGDGEHLGLLCHDKFWECKFVKSVQCGSFFVALRDVAW